LAAAQYLGRLKIVRLPATDKKLKQWLSLWTLRNVLAQADIIHCHAIFWWYWPFKFLWPKKPVYTTFHGWEGIYPVPIKNILMHRLAEKLSCGSLAVGDYLTKWYGQRPDIVTYGAAGLTLALTARSKPSLINNRIVFIGRLDEVNSIKLYLAAIKKLKAKQKFTVIFVGDGPYRCQAEKLGRVTGMVKTITPYLIKPAYIFASSYLSIWEALRYGRRIFALYNNPVKKDYLQCFPAAQSINIAGSVEELIKQFYQPKPVKAVIPGWQKVAESYLRLWQK